MSPKVAAIQMVSKADIDVNLATAEALMTQAAAKGAKLVLLPENFAVLDGGPLRQFAEVEGDSGAKLQKFLSEQAKLHAVFLVAGTIPLLSRPRKDSSSAPDLIEDGRVRPACLVFNPSGDLIARYDKIHLFDVKVADKQAEYSESRSFEPGEQVVCVDTNLGRLGLSICYDLRFPELYRRLFADGAQIVTVPSAFTRITGAAHWEALLRARAIENQCFIVAANQGGKHNATRETFGHSMIIDPWGNVLDRITTGEGMAIASIELENLVKVRANMPINSHRRL